MSEGDDSGAAINVLAMVLTAEVLGLELGSARAAGASAFAFVVGIAMHLIHFREDRERITNAAMFQSFDDARDVPSGGWRPTWGP